MGLTDGFDGSEWTSRQVVRSSEAADMRRSFTLLLIVLVAVLAGCARVAPPSGDVSATRVATMYRSPTCTCCHEYEAILRKAGWVVDVVEIEDTASFKGEHGIPQEAWSCHTTIVDSYVVEGHVPLAAIDELLERGPAIDGIALPGMPAGSPGMGGEPEGPFVVFALQGGKTAPFGTF
jgi:hypothetical protein